MFVEMREIILQTIAYGMVVQSASERFLKVCSVLSFLQEMPIDTSIVAFLVAFWLVWIEAFVEFFRRIEMIRKAKLLAHIGEEEAIL